MCLLPTMRGILKLDNALICKQYQGLGLSDCWERALGVETSPGSTETEASIPQVSKHDTHCGMLCDVETTVPWFSFLSISSEHLAAAGFYLGSLNCISLQAAAVEDVDSVNALRNSVAPQHHGMTGRGLPICDVAWCAEERCWLSCGLTMQGMLELASHCLLSIQVQNPRKFLFELSVWLMSQRP